MAPKTSMPPESDWRSRHRELLGSPDDLGGITQNQDQRVGKQQLVEFLAPIDMAQQQPFDQPAEQRDAQRGDKRREPEAVQRGCEPLDGLPGKIRADHVE